MKEYKLVNNVLGWVVGLIASVVYLLTIEPTASFWDCGEFITSAFKLEVGHPPGNPFFMLTGNFFTQFASDPVMVGKMVNIMSALFSGFTILFLFWTITHMARKFLIKNEATISKADILKIMGCGLVGALVYTFSDTFWFSAVEGEVYAYSSLFTAVVFWLILKWEDAADMPHADRWIVLIAYLMGLSIGVHLLNLLCIPAIVLVYYFKKSENPNTKGALVALLISFGIVFLLLYGLIQGLVEVCGLFELFFVNVIGMPYNSGVFIYLLIVGGVLAWTIWETMREKIHPLRVRISFILTIVLLGIPFIGSGYLLGAILIVLLGVVLFKVKKLNVKLLNMTTVSLMMMAIGYSTYALIMIRATADTPMNQNKPEDIFTIRGYLAREQYGEVPLFYGNTYVAEAEYEQKGNSLVLKTTEGEPVWSRVIKENPGDKDKYYISRTDRRHEYASELKTIFPRMYSQQANHIEAYKSWANIKGTPVDITRYGETKTVIKPTFAENLRFFFSYQLNYMYWRYFMWNFSGRQNDIQGTGGLMNGNWITGIPFIDEILIGPAENMPNSMVNNKGHNAYYMLPLLLGLVGIFFQANSGKKGIQSFWVTFFLFFMTGIAIVLYLNQPPFQPRERDYAYAGSFYAFSIWIGFGVAALAQGLEKLKLSPLVSAGVATLAALFVPIQMASQNWDDHDRSDRYVARDFGSNYLESCEPNSVIFTNGDNDTFPLWYAQEVEGIRTDVRVCNMSYLQTDWYIDQMKKQAYESEPLPLSWDRSEYRQGTRDMALLVPLINGSLDLKAALDFVRSSDPKYKKVQGYPEDVDYIPSDILAFKVDSVAAIRTGTVRPEDADSILNEMTINLQGKRYLGKQELAVLDMLVTNNWERPIYYAMTVSPDQFVKLDPYFEQTGLAYRIVPKLVKGTSEDINTERMYDVLMNKFRWGGIENPGVYIDENVRNMGKNYRNMLFSRLSESLCEKGDSVKALNVLDRGMEVLNPENIPMDYSGLSMAELYYKLGQKEKAEEIYNMIAEDALRTVKWIFSLSPGKIPAVQSELSFNLMVLQEIIQTTNQYNPEYSKKYHEDFMTMSTMYNSMLNQNR